MKLDLPYPHKLLWPNGPRGNVYAVSREKKKHKGWAHIAALAQRDKLILGDGPVPVKITVHGKATGPLPDADNVSAALKAYQDGISAALGINDRNFAAPTVAYADTRTSRFIVEIGL